MKDLHTTNVVFYIEKNVKDRYNNECIAVLGDCSYDSRQNTSYVHTGQHSSIDISYLKKCRLATKEEYTDLFNELENNVGYNLVVKKRIKIVRR